MYLSQFKRVFLSFMMVSLFCSGLSAQVKSWGDQGNGTYINPILNADYSDSDAIRVGDKYYLVCSEFHFMGMPVLESEDLVNWRIIGNVYDDIDCPEYAGFERYGSGSWAPAIRYHDGLFYVYFCTPDEGLFMTTAKDPAGPWAPLHCVKKVEKWEDPCPFWDENGNAYLGRSQWGAGPIIIHRMSKDGRELLDDGAVVYTGPGAEGVKFHKINGYYYISIPEGGVSGGWQTVLRSKNIYGPYEKRVVLQQGATDINGPHQGAFIDTPDGEWWFIHFQWTYGRGRVAHLQPVVWNNGWPMPGVDIDHNGIGEPVRVWTKPSAGHGSKPELPASSDEFNDTTLGLQWRANHKFYRENIDLSAKPGYLTLTAMRGDSLRVARNTLVQKTMGYEGEAVVKLDCTGMTAGQRAGMVAMTDHFRGIGIEKDGKNLYLYTENDGRFTRLDRIKGSIVFFKITMDRNGKSNRFYYSLNGKDFSPVEEPFEMRLAYWKGPHIGVFSYNRLTDGGKASLDWFRYEFERRENFGACPTKMFSGSEVCGMSVAK